MADDFEYEIITEPNVAGFFTGPVDSQGIFLSEEIAAQAKAQATAARRKELREIKKLRGRLAGKRRRVNISQANYERGNAILDSRQDALERAEAPAKNRLPEPLDPYNSAMMNTLPPTRKPRSGNPNGNPRNTPRKDARLAGQMYYFSSRPCLRGHTSERFTSTACCVACQDIYRTANIDQVRKHSRDSHQRARDRKAQAKLDKSGSICDSSNDRFP